MNEPQTLVGIIDEASFKDAPPESDREWRRYDFKIRSPSGTRKYSTFDKGWPTNLKTGTTYRITFTTKEYTNDRGSGTNYNLTSATLVDPPAFGAQPTSNGQALPHTANVPPAIVKPPEPPTDDAKERVATGEPQAEFKSPSRSYDQNQDITEERKDRRTALMQAVEMDGGLGATDLLEVANDFFAWLRETSADVKPPSSPAEPLAEAAGRPAHQTGPTTVIGGPVTEAFAAGDVIGETEGTEHRGVDFAKLNAERKAKQAGAESDGGPPLFPKQRDPDESQIEPPTDPKITSMKALLAALKKDFGLGKADQPDIDLLLKRAGMSPLAEATNLQAVYDEIQRDRAEALYSDEQAESTLNTEA